MGRTSHVVSTASFIADHSSIVRAGRQIDWPNVPNSFKSTPGLNPVVVTVGVAGAAQGAVSVPVAALSGPIPNGTVLDFGTDEFAVLTAAAAAGATALTVRALVSALESGDTATYAGTPGEGKKRLPAGTTVGQLLHGTKVSPRIASTNPAIGFLESDAIEDDTSAAKSGYSVIIGGSVYEALMPDASGSPRVLPAAIKTELDTARRWFSYEAWSDSR